MAMKDLILVLNAGSSSLKFTLFIDKGGKLEAFYSGQVEGITTEPRLKIKDGGGNVVGEKKWPAGTPLGHEGAIEAIFDWGRSNNVNAADRVAAVGHRVVHGGLEYTGPPIVNDNVLDNLKKLVPL